MILDEAHSMPVSQMGNYQEYLKRIPAQLREIESAPVRQHMFGNPFKIDKVNNEFAHKGFEWTILC
jgi:integrator complex subunit 6